MKLIFALLFTQSIAFAAITINDISGVSNKERDENGLWTLYGGVQINGDPTAYENCSTTGTCDTCVGNVDGGGLPVPCNTRGVFEDTRIIFQISAPSNATGRFLICNGNDQISESTNLSTPLEVTWSQLCSKASTSDPDCSGTSQSYQVGVGTACDNMGENKQTIKVLTRGVDVSTGSTYTPGTYTLPPTDVECASGIPYGGCAFRMFPGDKKAYVDSVGVATNFPDTDVSGIKYKNLVFFYESTGRDPGDESNDVATYNTINTSFTFGRVGVNEEGDPSDSSIDGLNNEVRYCFKLASEDQVGNIDRISHTDCTAAGDLNDAAANCNRTCLAPSEVMGLLHDKKCFIATAAYGSPLDSHVNLLRNFRDQFMIPNTLGRKLVKIYYKLSPPLAKWIAGNDVARTIVQGLLWPILGWASLSLAWGWWGFALPFLAMGLAYILIRRRRLA